MSGDLISRDVNRYLSDRGLIAVWGRIGSALTDAEEGTLRAGLLDARLQELFQLAEVPATGADAAARFRQVRNAVNKQATSSNRAQIADAVRKGLDQLADAELRWNPGALSFWGWYFPALADRREEKVTAMVEQILRQYSPIGAADERDLTQRLVSSGLDESGRAEVLARIPADAVRVVPTVPAELRKRLDAADTANILELIRPQSWQQHPGLRYSAFTASPEHEDPVQVAELPEAISFFDSRQRQSSKDALLGLSESCGSDRELQDAVLSYHLVKVHEARQFGFPQDVVGEFRHRGLLEPEAARLLGQSVTVPPGPGVSELPSVREFSAPELDAEDPADPADPADPGAVETGSFDRLHQLLEQGYLGAAETELASIPDRELQGTAQGNHAVQTLAERRAQLQDSLRYGQLVLQQREFSRAIVALRQAEAVGQDVPEVLDFRVELEGAVTQPPVIQETMRQAALVKAEVPGIDLAKKTGSPSGFFFKYIGPASFLDHLIFLAGGELGPSGIGHYLVAVILISLGVVILSSLSTRRVRTGKKWPTVLGAMVVGGGLLFNFYWLTLITVLIFLWRYRKMYLPFVVRMWNRFIDQSETLFRDNGLLAGAAGIYRYRSEGNGEQIFPTAGGVRYPIAPKYQRDGQEGSLWPGDLVLVDAHGEVLTHIKAEFLPDPY